jgi:hypothetical protein
MEQQINGVKEMFNVTEVLKFISDDIEHLASSLSNLEEHNQFLHIFRRDGLLWTPPVGIRSNIVRKISLLLKSPWGGISHTIALLTLLADAD